MPRVTFSLKPMVQIIVQGERAPATPGAHLPRARADGGLLRELLEWELAQEIYPLHLASSGAGRLCAYYTAEDAAKVKVWLKARGARCVGWRRR